MTGLRQVRMFAATGPGLEPARWRPTKKAALGDLSKEFLAHVARDAIKQVPGSQVEWALCAFRLGQGFTSTAPDGTKWGIRNRVELRERSILARRS